MRVIKNFLNKLSSLLFSYQNDAEKSKFDKDHNPDYIFYKENITVKGLLSTLGFWTKYIQSQKIDLINTLLVHQDKKLGYYQNLIKAQQVLSKRKGSKYQNLR